MFVDEVDIRVIAGDGGRGCVSFRREKFVPRGGPNGGDGGNGGSVYVVASPRKNTLVDFRYHPEFEARRGRHGQGSNKTGQTSEDLEIEVPIGTLVFEKSAGADSAGDDTAAFRGPYRRRPARAGRQGGSWRTWQRAFRIVDQPCPTPIRTRRRGRRTLPAPPAETPRRRRPRGLSECRQVNAHRPDIGCASEDRRLPVHDAHTESRRRLARRRSQLCRRRRAGPHRGCARRAGPWRSVSATHRAHEGADSRCGRVRCIRPGSGERLQGHRQTSCSCSIRQWRRNHKS